MAQTRNHQKSNRILSVGSGGGAAVDHHEYPIQTLFEHIKEKQLPFLSNVVIIGRLRDSWDKQPELGDYYQKFINSLPITIEKTFDSQQHNTPEDNNVQPATGLLLIFPTLFIHYLEVTNSAMKSILEDLNQSINNRDGLIREALILNISYNIQTRLYPNWSFKSIKLAVEDLDAQPAETPEAIAIEILSKLLRLARYQAEERQRNERSGDVLANFDQQRADLLPNQVNINFLLKQPIFRTAEDILKNYNRPINVRFESDLTAPPTHRLFPITF
ncbi:unnamed protein product [Rotaria sp. Silwood2]|nr:unnamed protein product [Rotaria sp. Silwood2]CAF2691479.1 unnamed protein product [Rotaria sp. Silwood2]CAF2939640.1 unnamed protein product [Rotaria sp. Silwood2]CAF3084075.1 unnamed protein product [Rotaria sp. Silwood2]CAF4081535.1 unnamed protein product [Rotaria sp. Silwood2]